MQNFIKIGSVLDEYERETDLNRKIQRGGEGGRVSEVSPSVFL